MDHHTFFTPLKRCENQQVTKMSKFLKNGLFHLTH